MPNQNAADSVVHPGKALGTLWDPVTPIVPKLCPSPFDKGPYNDM